MLCLGMARFLLTVILLIHIFKLSAQDETLETVRNYAESYSPTSQQSSNVPSLHNVPDSIVTAFHNLKTTDRKEYEKQLALIFIKLYRAHIECCNQSYELRNSLPLDRRQDPLIYAFILLTNYFQAEKPTEFISSSIAYKWIQENPHITDNASIREQIDVIEKILRNLEEKD